MTTRRSSNSIRRKQDSVFARLIAALRGVLAALTSSYHPERHYMRGGKTGGVA